MRIYSLNLLCDEPWLELIFEIRQTLLIDVSSSAAYTPYEQCYEAGDRDTWVWLSLLGSYSNAVPALTAPAQDSKFKIITQSETAHKAHSSLFIYNNVSHSKNRIKNILKFVSKCLFQYILRRENLKIQHKNKILKVNELTSEGYQR
jgi:hypothetical protein